MLFFLKISSGFKQLKSRVLTSRYREIKIPGCIRTRQEDIDLERIAGAAKCSNHGLWRNKWMITPVYPEQYHGHPIDSKTEQLVSYVRIDHISVSKDDNVCVVRWLWA